MAHLKKHKKLYDDTDNKEKSELKPVSQQRSPINDNVK